MARTPLFLILCSALLLPACEVEMIAGSGNIVTQSRSVAGFQAVSMGGSGRLFVEQGPTESLTVTADDNLMQYIDTKVVGDQLELGFGLGAPMRSLQPTKPIEFHLTVKTLDEVDLSGSGVVDMKKIDGERLKAGISGSGTMTAAGVVNDLTLSISGSGKFDGADLHSVRTSVGISGSGRARVATSDQLSVDVSGSGSVEYTGNPQVSKDISGSGSVRRVD